MLARATTSTITMSAEKGSINFPVSPEMNKLVLNPAQVKKSQGNSYKFIKRIKW
jgi:hypothetical protein